MTGSPLESLLDEMSDALKAADFSKLESLITRIEAAEDMKGAGLAKADLLRLQNKARQNGLAALAAGRGVRAALQRVKDIRETALSLRTYDRLGNRSAVSDGGKISRRL